MVKNWVFMVVVFLIMILPMTSAITVRATVIVEPFHSAFVQVANPKTQTVVAQHYNQSTKVDGKAYFEFNTGLKEVSFFVKSVNPVSMEKYELWIDEKSVSTSMEIDARINEYDDTIEYDAPEKTEDNVPETLGTNESEAVPEGDSNSNAVDVEVTIEDPESEQEIIEEEDGEPVLEELSEEAPPTRGITGMFVTESGALSTPVYYMIAIIAFLAILLIIVIKARGHLFRMPMKKKNADPIVSTDDNYEKRLSDAQNKIIEAMKEIEDLKKSDADVQEFEAQRKIKIQEAREEFRRAKERYKTVKKGKDLDN